VRPAVDKATTDLKDKLARVERDLAHYQAQVHDAHEKLTHMTSAATSAAASTVTAIERIQEMEKVVLAAEEWVAGGSHAALVDAVKAWQKLRKAWS
jgi:hypothetical protein